MAIKDLPKYKDIRGTIRRKGRYPFVGTRVKDTHVIHHSMTAQHLKGSTPEGFANTHINSNGWPGIAYPFVIMPDGTIYQCDDLDRRTYHAGDTNTRSIGTCLVGDFRIEGAVEKPTPEQMLSLFLLNKELYEVLPNMKRTIGHQECPGYSWKNCPGNTWNYKEVIAGKVYQIAEEKKEELTVSQAEKLQKQIDDLNKKLKLVEDFNKLFYSNVSEINNSVSKVLKRFEQKDPALAAEWRKKFLNKTLSLVDAVGLLYVAVERGYIQGIPKE